MRRMSVIGACLVLAVAGCGGSSDRSGAKTGTGAAQATGGFGATSGTGGTGGSAAGGTAGTPGTGGVGAAPTTGGTGAVPTTGGTGAVPTTGGTGAVQATGGNATGGAGAAQPTGGNGAVQATGGDATGGLGGATGGAGGVGGSTDVCPAEAQACYYVSPTGSDEAVGSAGDPFQSITKARDTVRTINADMTGDIHVYLFGGDYRVPDTVTFGSEDSATNDHRIYYQAYPGQSPVLNGSTPVTGWTQHDGTIYSAALDRSTKLRNLYVNDARAFMASKSVRSNGGYGTFSVTQGEASWAWQSGSGSDGIKYGTNDVPEITSNQDDLEIVNGTTWNENIACVRAVETTSDNNRGLLLQQPYGAIAQLPGWGAGFSVTGTHTLFNAYEFLSSPGDFFFDKTASTLYYIPRPGEDMSTAAVEAPVVEKLLDIAGTSRTDRVRNITFQGITFAHTDYNLYQIEDSRGKASVQGATVFVAYGNGDWHASKYEIVDTVPGMISVNNAEAIDFVGNVIKHSGSEGITMHNDVLDSNIVGNYITDAAGSGIAIGHPQHVYVGDGGTHARYSPDVEGVCTGITINNNFIYDVSTAPGFGGHAGITAFFVDTLAVTHNHIELTAYIGISLGWGWMNFKDSTTCKDNTVSFNRLISTMNRMHDSGAIYTIGQNPGTYINENYVKGIPPAASGPTYGLHNDEGSAYITENDSILDIDPGVKYTINCEDFGDKHDLTILRTYATVNKMGVNPPSSQIDTPVVVPDAVWPVTQYGYCLNSGVEDAHRTVVPSERLSPQDYVFPASCEAPLGTLLDIRSSGNADNTVWFAPEGTSSFVEGDDMTQAAGDATSIPVPATSGTYRLFIVDSQGQTLGESEALLRVTGG